MNEEKTNELIRKKSFLSKMGSLFRSEKLPPLEERKCFLITSSGQMGTFWLATQLNKHPEIFCSHSYDKPAWGASGTALRGEEGERQRAVIKKYFGTLPLKQFFEENAEVTPKHFVGNVHAYNVEKALSLVKKENLQDVKIINLIRHPISRINSFVKCMKNEWFDFGYFDHLTFIPQNYREYGRKLVIECFGEKRLAEFDDSLDKQFFVTAAVLERGTAYQAQMAEQNKIPNIKYEDATTSKESMAQIVRYIGNDSLINDYDWFDKGISYKKINSHTNAHHDTIQSIFEGWDNWKKELYRHLVAEDVFELYLRGHYDFVTL